jgi:hypothetical protein
MFRPKGFQKLAILLLNIFTTMASLHKNRRKCVVKTQFLKLLKNFVLVYRSLSHIKRCCSKN